MLSRWPSRSTLALAALSAALLAGCGKADNSGKAASSMASSAAPAAASLADLERAPSAPVALTETGSTLLYPLFNLWAPAYSQGHPNIKITTAGTGSGTGISQAAAGTVNIGASDAYLSPAQMSQNPGLENVPLAISSQMVNYNLPGFQGTLKLSGTVLARIYEGKITRWNDARIRAINPGVRLPARRIVPVHRSDGSGDTFIFSQYLSDQDPGGWGKTVGFGTTVAFPAVPGALGENGNGGMVSGCAVTPGCVAYIGVSFRTQTRAKHLGEAEISNGSGNYVALTDSSVAAEAASFAASTPASGAISLIDGANAPRGYPIINYEYAIVNAAQPNADAAQAVKALLAWAMDPNGGSAPSFLDQVAFQPLPPSAVTVATRLIANIH